MILVDAGVARMLFVTTEVDFEETGAFVALAASRVNDDQFIIGVRDRERLSSSMTTLTREQMIALRDALNEEFPK